MPLVILHHLLNASVQLANKRGLKCALGCVNIVRSLTIRRYSHFTMIIITANVKISIMSETWAILIWTYGIQLWGTTSNSNIEILECFQSKVV
jgi:hypothetical protein